MPISPKEYPTIIGKDAEKFAARQMENRRILKEKVHKKLKSIIESQK